MLAITCAKCTRRFTPNEDEVRGLLDAAEGKKFVLVLCPHCGKGNKVAIERLEQAVRFASRQTPDA